MTFQLAQVAEILVQVAGETNRRSASGYLIRDQYVLTCQHAFHGDVSSVEVRFSLGNDVGWSRTAVIRWQNEDLDIGVLEIQDLPVSVEAAHAAVTFGVIQNPPLDCFAVGFPQFKNREHPRDVLPDGQSALYAEYEHASGTATPWSGFKGRRLGFTVTSRPERSYDPTISPWAGMSGAAVFAKDSDLLVGVVAEHHLPDGLQTLAAIEVARWYEILPKADVGRLAELIGLPLEQNRLAVATTRPLPGGVPDFPGDVLESATRSYLNWVIQTNSRLEVTALADGRDIKIDLERVYVELKVDFSSADEREAARINRLRQINGELESDDSLIMDGPDKAWLLTDRPPLIADVFGETGPFTAQADDDEVLTIGELYQRSHAAVILGDPGSGKTTIARWLALLHAQTLGKGEEVVRINEAAMSGSGDRGQVDFGPPLLPILVSVAAYAEDRRQRKSVGDRPRTLLEFLSHAWPESPPLWRGADIPRSYRDGLPIEPEILAEVFHKALREGRALVLLDGLDEVPRLEREDVAKAVNNFITLAAASWTGSESTAESGTKIIATSRVAGYQDAPLSADLTQVTIQPMTEAARTAFIRTRLTEVLTELRRRTPTRAGPTADEAFRRLAALLADEKYSYIRSLAANPLLAGVIISVFINNAQTLPRQRVELYASAIKTLTEVWKRRLTGTYSPQIASDIFAALPTVAEHIHDTRPTGVIDGAEFRTLMRRSTSRADPHMPPETWDTAIDSLQEIMLEELGLLVASGPEAFRFAHRTFQEYLAAQHLIADPDVRVARIRSRLGDSQWREPILMAIGLINWQHRESMTEFTKSLLEDDGPLGALFPETALLLAAAVPQMAEVPPLIVRLVVRRLLASYLALFREDRMPRIRDVLTTAIVALRSPAHEREVDAVLIDALEQSDADPIKACASARLVREIGAASPQLATALMHAAANSDEHQYGSPITETLGLMLSPSQVSESGELDRRLPADSWGGTDLVMRDTLRSEPVLVDSVRSEPRHLAVLIALYGGYANLGAADGLDAYRRLSNLLKLHERGDREFAAYFGNRYRTDMSIDGTQVFAMVLDRRHERREAKRRFASNPRFDVETIARDSPLTAKIIETLEDSSTGHLSLSPLIEFLQAAVLRRTADPLLRADALVALWALGESNDIPDPDDPVLDVADRRIRALLPGLVDATIRAAPLAGRVLADAASMLAGDEWNTLGAALTGVLYRAGADPISVMRERDRLPDHVLPRVLAEELAQVAGGWSEDPRNSARRFTAIAAEVPLSTLLEALSLQGVAWSNGYQRHSYWWPADPLAFPPESLHDLPLAAVDQLIALPAEMTHLFRFLQLRLHQDLPTESRLGLVELGVVVSARVRGNDEEPPHGSEEPNHLEMLGALDQHFGEISELPETLRQESAELPDPWWSARALLRVAEFFPPLRESALRDARRAAARITDPARAYQLYERLALLSPPPEAAEHAAECRTLVKAIEDPALAARALLRTARLVPAAEINDVLSDAVQQMRHLPPSAAQLELLRLLAELFPDRPHGHPRTIRLLHEQLADSTAETSIAADDLGGVIARYLPSLCRNDEQLVQALTPIALYERTLDVVRSAEQNKLDWLWQTLLSDPSPDSVRRLLAAYPDHFVRCTGAVARRLDSVLSGSGVHFLEPILSCLVRMDPDAEPVVRSWVNHSLPRAREVAALLIAERHWVTSESADQLANLLLSGDDLLQSRARRCLAPPGPAVVQMSVTTMGAESVSVLADFVHQYREQAPGMTDVLSWQLSVLLHDDPSALSDWCDRVPIDGSLSAATWIVRRIRWTSTPTWRLLLERLRYGPTSLQASILAGIPTLLYRNTDSEGKFLATDMSVGLDSARWAQLYDVLSVIDSESLSDASLFPIGVDNVFDTVDEVVRGLYGDIDGRSIRQASKVLRMHSVTSFGAILAKIDESSVRRAFYQVGESQTVNLNDRFLAIQNARNRRRMNRVDGPWMGLLRSWASRLLQARTDDPVGQAELGTVLEALAAAASIEPESFRHGAARGDLSGLLAAIASHQQGYPTRAAIAQLLGLLQHGSPAVFSALRELLRDSAIEVRQAASEAFLALRSVDRRLIHQLSETLSGVSVTAALASSQLLAVIGENAMTRKSTRDEIIARLAEAVQAPQSRRTVHFAFADAALPVMPELDEVFTQALRRVYRLD